MVSDTTVRTAAIAEGIMSTLTFHETRTASCKRIPIVFTLELIGAITILIIGVIISIILLPLFILMVIPGLFAYIIYFTAKSYKSYVDEQIHKELAERGSISAESPRGVLTNTAESQPDVLV